MRRDIEGARGSWGILEHVQIAPHIPDLWFINNFIITIIIVNYVKYAHNFAKEQFTFQKIFYKLANLCDLNKTFEFHRLNGVIKVLLTCRRMLTLRTC